MIRRFARPGLSGFTLLEMMLAIAILAVVMMMVAGSFNAVAHSKVHAESHLEIDREGRAILWQMSNELRGTVQTPLAPSNVLLIGMGQMRNRLPLDSLSVSTLSAGHRRAIQGFGAEDVVVYSASTNPRRRGWFVLTRSQASALLGGAGAPSAPSVVLADNLVSLHLRYFNGIQWLESWDSSALAPNQQLPVAVAIGLLLANSDGRLMSFSTLVTLPMAISVW